MNCSDVKLGEDLVMGQYVAKWYNSAHLICGQFRIGRPTSQRPIRHNDPKLMESLIALYGHYTFGSGSG